MKNFHAAFSRQTLLMGVTAFALSACGGGSGSSTSQSPTSPPVSSTPIWTKGSFPDQMQFMNRCEVVRTGTDSNGMTFPDLAGSTIHENFWLRSWSHETYLWNREIEDQNPATFSSPVAYFAELKTFATTASGTPKDDFHFSQPTEEYLDSRNNTPTSGYGARLRSFKSSAPNRDFRILYTESNSPASEVVNGKVQFPRGARILEVDGADLINGNDVDTLNAGLFPATAGETHTFRIQDPDGSAPRNITITSQDIAPEPVNRTKIITTPTGKVGYMLFNTFSPSASEKSLADGITALNNQGVDDFVLDLRYNGGGLLAVAAQLGYMVAGDTRTNGKTFELLQYNADANGRNPTSGENEVVQPFPFYNEGLGFSLPRGQALDTLNLPRVFILSTGGTCSASEAVINGLRGIDVEVILIGDITCGKPYGFLPTSNCGETYYTIQFRGVNEKGFGDYSDGFVPNDNGFGFGVRLNGCTIDDDLSTELGDENEALLQTALYYRDNNSCPAASSTKTSSKYAPPARNQDDYVDAFSIFVPEDMPENNRSKRIKDATMPSGPQ